MVRAGSGVLHTPNTPEWGGSLFAVSKMRMEIDLVLPDSMT